MAALYKKRHSGSSDRDDRQDAEMFIEAYYLRYLVSEIYLFLWNTAGCSARDIFQHQSRVPLFRIAR